MGDYTNMSGYYDLIMTSGYYDYKKLSMGCWRMDQCTMCLKLDVARA